MNPDDFDDPDDNPDLIDWDARRERYEDPDIQHDWRAEDPHAFI